MPQADKVKAILGTGLKGLEYVSLDASTADLARLGLGGIKTDGTPLAQHEGGG